MTVEEKITIENYFKTLSNSELHKRMSEAQHIMGEFQKRILKKEVTDGKHVASTKLLGRSVASEIKDKADGALKIIDTTQNIKKDSAEFIKRNPEAKEKLDSLLKNMTPSSQSDDVGNISGTNDTGEERPDTPKTFAEAESDDKEKKNFGSEIKECIPCHFRLKDLESLLGSPQLLVSLTMWLDDLKQLWKDLKDLFNQEFPFDFCNLFDALHSHCLPDLAKLLALFSMMQLKLLEKVNLSWENGLSLLIGPILSPILGQLSAKVDQFRRLITEPLECVLNAIDSELAKLDIQDVLDEREIQKNIDKNKRNARLTLEENFLRDKKSRLERELKTYNEMAAGDPKARANAETFAKQADLPGATTSDSSLSKKLSSASRTVRKETISRDLKDIDKKLKEIKETKGTSTSYGNEWIDSNVAGNKGVKYAAKTIRETRESVRKAKQNISETLLSFSQGIRDGITMIQNFIEVLEDELSSLMGGSMSAMRDKMYLMKELAKIARWVAIINGIIKAIAQKKTLCKDGNKSGSVSGFAKMLEDALKGSGSSLSAAELVVGGDSAGILLSSSKNGLYSRSFNENAFDGKDPLMVTFEETLQEDEIANLDEIAQLNKKGIIPKIEIKQDTEILTKRDGQNGQDYYIYTGDFCSQSAHNVGSSETVKKWMVNNG